MRYVSTRGDAQSLSFESVTRTGLAPDGGLYLPSTWPCLDSDRLTALRGAPYHSFAVEVMRPFVEGSLADAELTALCKNSYSAFDHPAVTPLRQLDDRNWLLELFHGPSLAFKDIALQLLGRLFKTILERNREHLTIIGATSGDTGSAALTAVADQPNMDIVMLHPAGRISEVQRRQMTTLHAPNIHNVAIEGSFDDAQAIVKRMFTDPDVSGVLQLGAVNSINWARLMAQIVYYFYAAVQLGAPDREVAFSVPTGNFGDVFAGYVAKQMGLPIHRLIVATNENDILHRALARSDYSRRGAVPTLSPSMDIQVSSNFERLLYCEGGSNGQATAAQMREFERTGTLRLTDEQLTGMGRVFSSAAIDNARCMQAMRKTYDETGVILDPHTAVGLAAARDLQADGTIDPTVPMVTLATAHPAKFPDAVENAIGRRPDLPERFSDLFDREERYTTLAPHYDIVRDYVLQVR